MERQGYRLHLTNAEAGVWRATFSRHPMTSAEGFGAAATPWGAITGGGVGGDHQATARDSAGRNAVTKPPEVVAAAA
jgi:hypothetical protein